MDAKFFEALGVVACAGDAALGYISPRDSRQRLAVHEAGHAVVAHKLGAGRVRWIALGEKLSRTQVDHEAIDVETRVAWEADFFLRAHGAPGLRPRNDEEVALRAAMIVNILADPPYSAPMAARIREGFKVKADCWVNTNLPHIVRVADAILSRGGNLGGEIFEGIVERRIGAEVWMPAFQASRKNMGSIPQAQPELEFFGESSIVRR